MECPSCGGRGCGECKDGQFELDACPMGMVTPDVWELLGFADLYEKGLPPVEGGVLDQTRSFTEGCRFVWSERQRWKAEAGSA